MLSIDSVRELFGAELRYTEPKKEKKPSSEFFTKEDCGDYLKLTWKG